MITSYWEEDYILVACYVPVELHLETNGSSGFLTKSDTYQPVQSLKKATCLKFYTCVEEEMFYRCSENKGAKGADLRLCFHIGKNPVFSCHDSYMEFFMYCGLIESYIDPVL